METRLEWINDTLMQISSGGGYQKIMGYIQFNRASFTFEAWIRDATHSIQARPIGDFNNKEDARRFLKEHVIAELVSDRFDRANTN